MPPCTGQASEVLRLYDRRPSLDARLAALRTKLEQRHATQSRELDLRLAALKIAPEPGIIGAEVVLANVYMKSIKYEDGSQLT
jgi:hypothetical protein